MICFPNAKINLGLHIVSRRSDGYHNLETIFYPIGMRDALEIIPTPEGDYPASGRKFRFFQTGNMIPGREEDNLVIKALQLFAAEKEIPIIDIYLLKKFLPVRDWVAVHRMLPSCCSCSMIPFHRAIPVKS